MADDPLHSFMQNFVPKPAIADCTYHEGCRPEVCHHVLHHPDEVRHVRRCLTLMEDKRLAGGGAGGVATVWDLATQHKTQDGSQGGEERHLGPQPKPQQREHPYDQPQ